MPRSRQAAANVGRRRRRCRVRGRPAVWPPSGDPIAQGLPTSSARGRGRVVAALALGDADRMDRREVDDVESQSSDVVEAIDRLDQCARAGRLVVVLARRSGPTSGERTRTRRRTRRGAGRRRRAAAGRGGRRGSRIGTAPEDRRSSGRRASTIVSASPSVRRRCVRWSRSSWLVVAQSAALVDQVAAGERVRDVTSRPASIFSTVSRRQVSRWSIHPMTSYSRRPSASV